MSESVQGGRVLIISNRLPITLSTHEGVLQVKPSMGGLATCLNHVRRNMKSLWIGWHGSEMDPESPVLERELEKEKLVAIPLSQDEVKSFYQDFSNAILWPLYHYLPAQLPMEMVGLETYRRVNQKFADKVREIYQPGDIIWVHDYQLSLLPQMLREALPQASITFFLHIPFPSSEVFRILPCREEILRGMLGADVLGFHTNAYVNNFVGSVLRILGIDSVIDTLILDDGRTVKVSAHPLGVNVQRFEEEVLPTEKTRFLADFKISNPSHKIFLSVDRLDYTKGIPRRLLAFEKMLEARPDLVGNVIFIQLAVPSRMDVEAFDSNKRTVDEIVGRVNGKFALPGYFPIHYVNQSFNHDELLSLYRMCDIMVVTPLRDGMNLVAKEFCASRTDCDGVLILSEFAGAADEMGEALIVNPYDLEGMRNAYIEAMEMEKEERKNRMLMLRKRLSLLDYRIWASNILDDLKTVKEQQRIQESEAGSMISPQALRDLCRGRNIALLLDYDGTLTPITRIPELARPDKILLQLLKNLQNRRDLQMVIVSGRDRQSLETWLGDLPCTIFAEHGAWRRRQETKTWESLVGEEFLNWKAPIRQVLDRVTLETPGSFIEEKDYSLVWHYRMVDPLQGVKRSRELMFQLQEVLHNLPLGIIHGKKIVEVHSAMVNKGQAVTYLKQELPSDTLFLAIGDDATDENMFRTLPPDGLSIRVGKQISNARYTLKDVSGVRKFLELMNQP